MRAATKLLATALAGVGVLLDGCGLGPSPTQTTTTIPSAVPSTTTTSVTTNVIRDQCQLGKAETFAPGLQLVVGSPTASTGPLGTGNGYPPKYGYYLTFQVSAKDVGGVANLPLYVASGNYPSASYSGFVLDEAGDSGVTVNTGNTPFDGSLTTLDNTFLSPGQSDHGAVIFDVPRQSGLLHYYSSGALVCNWSF